MATAHVLISTQTLASAVSSVTFSSISSSYRDLILVNNTSASAGAFTTLRFNGDAASNYQFTTLEGNGSSAVSNNSASTMLFLMWAGTNDLSATQSNSIVQIFDYSATDKIKTTLSRVNSTAVNVVASTGKWNSTAAITSVTVMTNGAPTFNIGSTFSLYGVLA